MIFRVSAVVFWSLLCIGCVATDPNKITIYTAHNYELPDSDPVQPNDATLWHYYSRNDTHRFQSSRNIVIEASPEPYRFNKSLETSSKIEEEMSSSTVLSYLYLEEDTLVYDAVPSETRFKGVISDDSYFVSNSAGKSVTSYILGHAICQGYIDSIDSPITDWPLMESTLYYGQPLINLLNMRAGDSDVIGSYESKYLKSGRHFHDNAPLSYAVNNELELKNTKPKKNPPYSYSNLATDVLMNYTMHRVGYGYEEFLTKFFHEKVKNEHPIYFYTMQIYGAPEDWPKARIDNGAGTYMFWATRYDYLRIAKAMMQDWQNDSCEGQYLKSLYERRVSMNRKPQTWNRSERRWGYADFGNNATKYGGQFWTDFYGLSGRTILMMNGYNGQQVIMDMDNSRIVVINAIKSNHYNTRTLGYEPIKYGRIQ